ncbi:hypothetical protein G7Z17_g11168 [Cylindrodendrum hubeiense]|uniref:Uncharacterized protein n=1 Tax=Cylindrodendrum hubeiense TaxID=595255 RepID=A0A9P5H1B0_9HYPO|nr:hypothetical protein G7Z17_g11168 [Cylindrodendrum hubeiense]
MGTARPLDPESSMLTKTSGWLRSWLFPQAQVLARFLPGFSQVPPHGNVPGERLPIPNLTSSLHLHNSFSSRPLRPRDRVASLPRVSANRVNRLCAVFKLAPSDIATRDSFSYVIIMSDGIAPAIDKVGEAAPKAAEAEAAPTVAPASKDSKPDEKKFEDGAKPGLKVPKPVEITSVPQTPLNNGTPVGGTPRPELKIDEEPKETPKEEEAPFILGLQEPESTPVDKDSDPIADKPAEAATNGASKDIEIPGALPSSASSESASREKRKLEEEPVAAKTNGNGNTSSEDKSGPDERTDKKARVEDAPAPATNGKGKAKREKKAAPVVSVGRTARKTRSQGPVEV